MELSLFGSIAHPVEAHVDGFGSLLLHCAIDDTIRGAIIGLNGCRWLWVTHCAGIKVSNSALRGESETQGLCGVASVSTVISKHTGPGKDISFEAQEWSHPLTVQIV